MDNFEDFWNMLVGPILNVEDISMDYYIQGQH